MYVWNVCARLSSVSLNRFRCGFQHSLQFSDLVEGFRVIIWLKKWRRLRKEKEVSIKKKKDYIYHINRARKISFEIIVKILLIYQVNILYTINFIKCKADTNELHTRLSKLYSRIYNIHWNAWSVHLLQTELVLVEPQHFIAVSNFCN